MTGTRAPDDGSALPSACAARVSGDNGRRSIGHPSSGYPTSRRLRRSGLEVPRVRGPWPGGDVAREAGGIGLRAELELAGADRQDVRGDPGVERELAGGGWPGLTSSVRNPATAS